MAGGGPPGSGAAGMVSSQIGVMTGVAMGAVNGANAAAGALAAFAPSVGTAQGQYSDPGSASLNYHTPTMPSFSPGSSGIRFPSPSGFSGRGISAPSAGRVPTFTGVLPIISLPPMPSFSAGDFTGTTPLVNTDIQYPDAPSDIDLPDLPTIESLSLPSPPTLDIPNFSAIVPTTTSIVTPVNSFYWSEDPAYSSECLDAVMTKLCDHIQNGGTGLSVEVEQAIYDRGRNREDIGSVRAEGQILNEQAARGFSRPQGSTFAALDMATQESQNKIADLSREIMIKQAEMEQQNFQFAVQQVISLEGALISEHQQIQTRSFEAAKYIQESIIQIFNANISKVTVELEAYKSYSAAYEAQVKAALSKVEIFKAEIEAQSLISGINKVAVETYSAQIGAIKSSVDIYKTQVDAASSKIAAEGLKIDLFKGEVDAYSAQVEAAKTQYQGYAEQVKGQLASASIYGAQVDAFVGRVTAYSKGIDAQATATGAQVAEMEARVKAYSAQVDAAGKQASAEAASLSANADVYRGQAAAFAAQVSSAGAQATAQARVSEASARAAEAAGNISVKNAEIGMENARASAKISVAAQTAAGEIQAAVAGSALSSISVGATANESFSNGYNTSWNNAYQETHYYKEK